MTGGPGHSHAQERFKASLEVPFGWFPQPVYFSTIARRHMSEYGTQPEQLGHIAVSARRHANGHPGAVMRDKKLSLEDYLARPMLVDPLRVEDCCLISDGGAAYIMTSTERARDLTKPPVVVAGVGVPITRITIPVAPGRNLAALVEAGVRNYLLRQGGYNASNHIIKLQAEAIEAE